MTRPRAITDVLFLKIGEEMEWDISKMRRVLDCSRQTVYNYSHRLGVKHLLTSDFRSSSMKEGYQMLMDYQGGVRMEDLAVKYCYDRTTVVMRLWKVIEYIWWSNNPPHQMRLVYQQFKKKFRPPRQLSWLKVYWFMFDEEYASKSDKWIGIKCNIRESTVRECRAYLKSGEVSLRVGRRAFRSC